MFNDDSPAKRSRLGNALHRQLFKLQVRNKNNPRKEFFRTDIDAVIVSRIVRENHGDVEYTSPMPSASVSQSLAMPEDDQQFIEQVFDELEDEEDWRLTNLRPLQSLPNERQLMTASSTR